jgi:copper oxidase (laccase) domain-containing protein
VAQGIARRAVEAMREAFGTRSQDLIAGLGPAIGPCCYIVGHEVAAAMGYALHDWSRVLSPQGEDKWRFDLPLANALQLRAEGVRHIEKADLCTVTHRDEFYSHRAENGETGRFAVVALLESRAFEAGSAPRERQLEAIPPKAEEVELTMSSSPYPPGFPAFGETVEGDS